MFMRVSVLTLIDATSFPALNALYMAPAYFTAIAAAVLSCAAWIQLSDAARARPVTRIS
jgi:hypothetical protein